MLEVEAIVAKIVRWK